jgi:uncharacterized membrane protein YphA (DoxX/SURF4 family)
MKWIDRGMVLFLAAIFLFSSIDKVLHYQGFVNAMRNYVLVPAGTAPFFAPPVIGVELLVGLGLLFPAWRRPAALTAASLLGLFTVAIALNHLYGDRGICGCWFTITLAKSTSMHLMQNLLMALMALVVGWESPAPARRSGEPPSAIEIPVAPSVDVP